MCTMIEVRNKKRNGKRAKYLDWVAVEGVPLREPEHASECKVSIVQENTTGDVWVPRLVYMLYIQSYDCLERRPGNSKSRLDVENGD